MKYRRIILVAALVALTAHRVLAQPVQLVVGSVRDQTGAPIEGAVVRSPGAGGPGVLTDADGTFALEGGNISRLRISCAYCVAAEVMVTPNEPVVAILHRYEALRTIAPSRTDIVALPYAHAQSDLGLRPFTVLEDTVSPLPGARIADRGLNSQGGLVSIGDVPNYDIVANASPFATIPDFYVRAFAVASPLDAFRYGDRAGAGAFNLDPASGGATHAFIVEGGETDYGYASAGANTDFSVGTSSSALDVSSAANAGVNIPLSNDALIRVSGGLAQGRATANGDDYLASSFSAIRARYDRIRDDDFHATLRADRGTYELDSNAPATAIWSDVSGDAGISSSASNGLFADVGWRASSGEYAPEATTIPPESATISQQYVDAGLRVQRAGYTVTAGVGAFDVGFQRASLGAPPLRAQILAPSLRITLAPGQRFSADIGTAQSFALPTILEAYEQAPLTNALAFNRNGLVTGTISYTDLARMRVEITGVTQSVRDRQFGEVSALGVAATWQLAPRFSVRAWALHVSDSTLPGAEPLYNPTTPAATVGSFWLKYQNPANVRIDAIWRRDLLDAASDEHLDGSLSAPLIRNLRWFIGSERYHRVRFVDFGIRFTN